MYSRKSMSKMQTYRPPICRLQTARMGRFGWDRAWSQQTPSGKDKDIIVTKIRLSNLRLIK